MVTRANMFMVYQCQSHHSWAGLVTKIFFKNMMNDKVNKLKQ